METIALIWDLHTHLIGALISNELRLKSFKRSISYKFPSIFLHYHSFSYIPIHFPSFQFSYIPIHFNTFPRVLTSFSFPLISVNLYIFMYFNNQAKVYSNRGVLVSSLFRSVHITSHSEHIELEDQSSSHWNLKFHNKNHVPILVVKLTDSSNFKNFLTSHPLFKFFNIGCMLFRKFFVF